VTVNCALVTVSSFYEWAGRWLADDKGFAVNNN